MVLASHSIFFGSPVMLIAPLLFLFLIDRMLIPQEEARMEELFSEQYLEYKRRVRRWL